MVENGTVNKIYENSEYVSNNQTSTLTFGEFDISLTKTSRIETVVTIENVLDSNVLLRFLFARKMMFNMKVALYVNENLIENSECYETVLQAKEAVCLRLIIQIDNIAKNASFNGNLNFNLNKVG